MVAEEKRVRRTSRRDFLCLGAGLALGAGATYLLTPKQQQKEFSSLDLRGATKVKITVLKTPSIIEFGAATAAGITPTYSGSCPVFQEGQEFIVDAQRPSPNIGYQPGMFCPYAWQALFPYAWGWYVEGDGGEWYNNLRVIISNCPDGVRPVSFKLEWI
jgi:uncharacterized repeat protein (TIGR04076 family)